MFKEKDYYDIIYFCELYPLLTDCIIVVGVIRLRCQWIELFAVLVAQLTRFHCHYHPDKTSTSCCYLSLNKSRFVNFRYHVSDVSQFQKITKMSIFVNKNEAMYVKKCGHKVVFIKSLIVCIYKKINSAVYQLSFVIPY